MTGTVRIVVGRSPKGWIAETLNNKIQAGPCSTKQEAVEELRLKLASWPVEEAQEVVLQLDVPYKEGSVSVAEALRWVATELDAQADELRQDWVSVCIRATVRARIETLSETAVMCRTAAARVERGEQL